MTAADSTTVLSDNLEAFLLLELSGLRADMQSQVMASVGNIFDPAKIATAMRVQFMQLHLSEYRQRGRVAMAATTAVEGSRRQSDAWYENGWDEG